VKYDHRCTDGGQRLGAVLVRIAEPEIARLEAQGEPDERCASCAFRPDAVPNGCLQTMLDALKAVAEDVPFLCHMGKPRHSRICHGWFAARRALQDRGLTTLAKLTALYPFSPDP
jgi:hypothetical protein